MSRCFRAVRVGVAIALTAAAAACTSSGAGAVASASAAPAAASTTSASAAATAAATSPEVSPTAGGPSPSSGASATGLPAEPPAATLAVAGGSTIAGALGSYTWRATGSDAPWLVGRSAAQVAGEAQLSATFGSTVPESWTAAWARVADGVAGPPAETVSGQDGVALSAPSRAGDWSLRVTVVFGPAANATYFWHLVVR